LPGTLRRLRVLSDWTFELFFPRDISVMVPPPEDLLRSIHLEEGEPLFQRGENPRGYFFIKSGSIHVTRPDGTPQNLPAGSVLDHQLTGTEGWNCNATANESCDVIVFRGRALDLLKTHLRLVPQVEPDLDAAKKDVSANL
jgi:NADH dehydrogenase